MNKYRRISFFHQCQDDSHHVAYSGDSKRARRLLFEYGIDKRWSKETLRARWDGASALLAWWRALLENMRSP